MTIYDFITVNNDHCRLAVFLINTPHRENLSGYSEVHIFKRQFENLTAKQKSHRQNSMWPNQQISDVLLETQYPDFRLFQR